jgi:o-succinylbenzoate synthase
VIHLRSVTLREIRLPLREPFRISSGTVQVRRILLLELEDRGGAVAWSECVAAEAPNYSYETVDTAWLALSTWLIPAVLDRDFPAAPAVHRALEAAARGHRMAKAALEMGAWGLEAELSGVSLSLLLGGERERVEVGVSLGIQDTPEALAERACREVAAGYRKIKLKIAPGADLEFVRAVRDAVGSDVSLMVDANAAYRESDTPRLLELDDFALSMIEQPLDGEDLLRHAELQRRLRTPVCLDESITSVDRAEDMIALRGGRIINIKPGRVGGLTASRGIHDRAREAGIPVWCGGMLESGIGRAYNVALASLPNFTLPGDLSPSRRYWAEDIVEPEWTMSPDGLVDVPRDRPGIGVEVVRSRVEALTTREERYF